MIKVYFFAQFRELLGVDHFNLEASQISSVSDVMGALSTHIEAFDTVIVPRQTLCAVNQTLVNLEHRVIDGDEVAFFPPVTGG